MIGIELKVLVALEKALWCKHEVDWQGMTFMWHTVDMDQVIVIGRTADDDYPVMLTSLVTYFAAMMHQNLTDEEPADIQIKQNFLPETRQFQARAVVGI